MRFLISFGISLFCTVVGCLIGGFCASLFLETIDAATAAGPQQWMALPARSFGMAMYAMIFTLPLSLAIFTPYYAWLLLRRGESLLSALVLPALIAVAIVLMDTLSGMLAAVYGIAIATVAHATRLLFKRVRRSAASHGSGIQAEGM